MSSTFVAWLDPLLAAIESGQADGVRARISQLEASNLVGLPLQLGPVRLGAPSTREGWFAIHVWPAATGVTPCLEGCVVEVSSWQKAADLVPRLERELHHRAKNSLQLASSLLAIEWDQTEEESCRDILRQVQARVSCISRVHEQLFAQASLTDVDFSIVAQNLAEELRNSIAPRVPLQVDASPVELDYERAIPAAILCSELFAASLCHLRQRDGAHLRVHIHSGAGALVVEVDQPTDSSPLEEGSDARRSIMSAMLRQLRAKVATLQDDAGNRITELRVPLAPPVPTMTRY